MLTGSSPLTRGKPHFTPDWQRWNGLIPAHAGKTKGNADPGRIERAHPRSRGENWKTWPVSRSRKGSSPLTRGKQSTGHASHDHGRLIPAHAGKTGWAISIRLLDSAHPRSRGENEMTNVYLGTAGGSSPLTRGKHFLTCAFTAQIDQILETLELAVSFGSYSVWVACATDAPQDQVRSIGLVLPSSRGAS